MKNNRVKYIIIFLVSVLIPVCADQLTKHLAYTRLRPIGRIGLIPGVLELQYLENRGAAFGILRGHLWLFIVFAVLCVGVCLTFSVRLALKDRAKYLAERVCLVFLAAGAVGNLIDRAVRGFVVDFIYFSLIDFPIFNLADTYVTISTVVLLIVVLFVHKDEEE